MRSTRGFPLLEVFPPAPGTMMPANGVSEIMEAALPVFDLFGTRRLQEVSYTTLTGAADSLTIESAVYPDGRELWKVLYLEVGTDDAASTRLINTYLKAVGTGFEVALDSGWVSVISDNAPGVRCLRNFWLPPKFTFHVTTPTLAAGKKIYFKAWYVEVPIGEVVQS